jgi:hypothetical protein
MSDGISSRTPLALAAITEVLLAQPLMETTQQFPVAHILLAVTMLINLLAVLSAPHEETVAYIEFTGLVRTDSGVDVAAQPAGTEHT